MESSWDAPHLGIMRPLIITVALTGAVPEKSRYPSLPVSPSEIADQALACAELGASTVHLHMRDSEGKQCQDPDRLLETIRLIRASRPDLIICATTTSRGAGGLSERLTALNLQQQDLPEMVSLTLGSYNTPTGINANSFEGIKAIAERSAEVGVKVELEIFEIGMVHNYFVLLGKGLLKNTAIANILLGVEGASPADPGLLSTIATKLPPGLEWAAAGIGRYQRTVSWLAIGMGGNVRVGMEDDPRGDFSGWSNIDSVNRVRQFADALGRAIETPHGARVRLGLDAK